MSEKDKPLTMGTENLKKAVTLGDEIQPTGTNKPLVEPVKEEPKGEKLEEFTEYKVEVIKDFVGQKKGDKITVSGNVATALRTKGLVKLI